MKIKFDNITATVEYEKSDDRAFFNSIKKNLRVMAPGAEYTREYIRWKKSKGKTGWDGKVNILNDTFATGLLPEVRKLLWQELRVSPTLIDERPKMPYSYLLNSSLGLKDHQHEAYKACVSNSFNSMAWHRGIVQVATGGGKTHIAMSLYECFKLPALFLVHRKDLVKQTAKSFKKFLNVDASTAVEGEWIKKDPNLIIATIQTLSGFDPLLLRNVRQVFFDEAHLVAASLAKGNQFVSLANLLTNANIRWGLTATPLMRDQYSNWLLKGVTGEIVYQKLSADLIAEGHLTPPKVTILTAPVVASCPNTWPKCYDSGIVLNSARNQMIIDQVKTIDKPCIIMCRQIAHANILQNTAKMAGLNIPILKGESDDTERTDIVNKLKTKQINTIICTTIFDEGIDIPELKSIILAGAGRSAIKQIQRIGRLLRKSEGKTTVTVIDFDDRSCKLLQKHSKERLDTCREQGFEVNIPR